MGTPNPPSRADPTRKALWGKDRVGRYEERNAMKPPRTSRLVPILVIAYLALPTSCACAGRYETFTKRAAQGPKMDVVAATCFGGEGIEEFVAAGGLPDGSIVALGNAWGPSFPAQPPPLVLGRGRHRGLDPYLPGLDSRTSSRTRAERILREDDPDAAGMLVFYTADLRAIRKVVRFDWGVASISAALVPRQGGGIYIAGRCTDAFATAVRGGAQVEPAAGGNDAGPYQYQTARRSGDVFIARLPSSGDGILWACVFQGARTPPARLWIDYEQNVYADIRGLVRIGPDGRQIIHVEAVSQTQRRALTATRQARYLAVDPTDGSFYYGGNRYTNTGREPWRQPYLYKFDHDGRRLWKLWEWQANLCASGGEGNGLCADSSVRLMDIAPDGTLVVYGWCNGGNSVFTRQPAELDQPAPITGFGMDSTGMKGPTSLAYLLRIDPKTQRVTDGSMFLAYEPENTRSTRSRGAHGGITLETIQVTDDGSIAFTGNADLPLIQTPNSLYKPPSDGIGYTGPFAAVFSPDFHNLLFSSYLPGCQNPRVFAVRTIVVIVSRCKASDPVSSISVWPTVNALQPQPRGDYNGHIMLLRAAP